VKNGLLQDLLNFIRNFPVRFSVGSLEERLKNILGNLLRYLYRWYGKVTQNSIYDEIQRTTDNTYRKFREVWTWLRKNSCDGCVSSKDWNSEELTDDDNGESTENDDLTCAKHDTIRCIMFTCTQKLT